MVRLRLGLEVGGGLVEVWRLLEVWRLVEVWRFGGGLLVVWFGGWFCGVCLGSLGLVWQHDSCSQLTYYEYIMQIILVFLSDRPPRTQLVNW